MKTPFSDRGKIPDEKRELALALLLAGKSYREVAEALTISIGSVHNIAKEPPEKLAPLVRELRARSAGRNYLLAEHILANISDMDISKAGLREKVLAASLLMEKAHKIETAPPTMEDWMRPLRGIERLESLEEREQRQRAERAGF